MQTYISIAFKELPPQTCLLLYFSCEPSYPANKKESSDEVCLCLQFSVYITVLLVVR